jgi:ketosteroid isomerase-like protein
MVAARDTAWGMSEEIVEVVRRGLKAFNGRDLAAELALWSPDAEVDWSRSKGPLKGVYRGHQGLKTFYEEFWSTFETVEIEIHELREVGRCVVVPNTAHVRGRDGIEVVARSTFVFTVENGLQTRLQMFQERAEALEAVHASESSRTASIRFSPTPGKRNSQVGPP